jgi:glutaminase
MPVSEAEYKSSSLSPIEHYLRNLLAKHAGLRAGKVADYIPELAKADPEWFGICIATRDGHVYEVGDTRQGFTIQSISKALVYGLALEDRGDSHVLSRIGVEPSGDAFNAISLKADSGAPFNPMINAGAIATCGQILKGDGDSRFARILAYLSACAGRPLDVDRAVYESESSTGHRNRAIGWMLRNFDVIEEDPTEILETYFRQCAIQVTCRDLALMGATLANQGRNPLTGEQAIAPSSIDNILSVMSTCGMYDYSGEWIYRVGLPAKSGVGGGILAVLPGQFGIGIFSPPLDERGNSARGIKVCEDLSHEFSLHLFASDGSAPASALRLSYDGSQVSSCRRRSPRVQALLNKHDHKIRLIQLQGELVFATCEPVVRRVLQQAQDAQYLVLDLQDVISINDAALKLINQLQFSLAGIGVRMVMCNTERFASLFSRHGLQQGARFGDHDSALEYCENMLLQEMTEWEPVDSVSLAEYFAEEKFTPDELDWLDARMDKGRADKGEYLIRAGDVSEDLYILLQGTVEIRLPHDEGEQGKRVNVLEAGMCFGEMGFLDGSPRSADVIALDNATYRIIRKNLFDHLDDTHPRLKIKLLTYLSSLLSSNLRRSNTELAAFKG